MSSCQKQTRPTQHQPTSSPCCTTSSVVLLALLAAPLVVVDKVCHWPLPAAAANYVPVSSQLFTSLQEFISFQELSESVLVVFIIVSSFIVAWFAYNQAAAPWLQTHLLYLASITTTLQQSPPVCLLICQGGYYHHNYSRFRISCCHCCILHSTSMMQLNCTPEVWRRP